ncbi:hypothetical protein PI124_g19824 [Phytophthora idaei]|nr:hypothetical protein PI124_g19824 [Phytophthora idaei]
MPSLYSDTPMLERVTSSGISKPRGIRFRSKGRSATASSLSSSTPPLSNSSNGSASKPRLHVDDDELCARAEAVARALDFRGLAGSNESSCRWNLNKSHGTFTTYARRPAAMTGPEEKARPTQQVLAAGEIRCHLEEGVHVLNTTTDFDHNAVMSGLYRKDFIYGSVVHVVPSNAIGDDPKLVELLQEEESTMTTRVAVKTGAFVHSKLFSRNEQWCFLERAQHIRAGPDPTENSEQNKLNSFTLTLSSLDEEELEAGKVNGHSRVKMLHGMDGGYLVEQLPGSRYVRVIFFGQFNGGLDKPGLAKSSQMRARLVRLADGATRLPEVEMENQDTRRVTPVRMCSRCMEFVENGDYSAVKPSALGKIQVMRDPMDQPPPNKTLARLLQKELRSSSGARKNSVRTVIQYLVDQEAQDQQERQARSIRLSSDSADEEYLDVQDGELNLRQVPLFKCVLANATKRNYPITMPKTAANGSVPDAPIPLNEKERLAAIARTE